MDERYIAAIDLGSAKIGLSVARVSGQDVEVIYYREKASDGVKNSAVFNPGRASIHLKEAIAEAEGELGIKIMQAVIGLPRWNVKQETAKSKIDRTESGTCILQEEIDTLKNMALDTYPLDHPEKEVIYGAEAQSFSIDDMINAPEIDVVGAPSSTLEGNFKVFVGEKSAMRNLDIMFNMAGIACAKEYFLPAATADVVLTTEEKENGVALIEMGAGVTSVTIYQGGIMRYYGSIPFGGKSITTDIRLECGFKEELSENIKLGFGICMPERLQTQSEKILQINDEENGTDQQLPLKYLSEIITCRLQEIMEAVLFMIQESGYADRLRNGIVITGGGANLVNCGNFIKDMSGYNVRKGFSRAKNISLSGCPAIAELSAVASVAMIKLASQESHLNCTTPFMHETEEEPLEVQEEQETATVSEEKAFEESVFNQSAWEEAPKEPKKPKPQKTHKLPKAPKLYFWEKIKDTVGNLYDSMDE